jgi:hypothetical protein
VEVLILIVVALGAMGAFGAGVVLLFLYFRAGRAGDYEGEPLAYSNLIQCPRCHYMNPPDTGACLNCRLPFTRATGAYGPPPGAYPPSVQAPLPPQQQPYAPPPAPMSAAVPQVTAPSRAAAPPGMPRAWLEGVGGVMLGHTVMLTSPDTMVGRSTTCDVQVFDAKVSRRHFQIRYAQGAFFLQDQQSSRGTLINGRRVMAQKLQNGDRIDVGDTSMVFRIQ